jgi:hypothetical protein
MTRSVTFAVEWNSESSAGTDCSFEAVATNENLAAALFAAMAKRGHSSTFLWGNGNAWASDWDHPDFGGDSLNWTDNVEMMLWSGHGIVPGSDEGILFPSNHPSCASMLASWKLGAKRLRWVILDCCDVVRGNDAASIRASVLGSPTNAASGVHIILSLIGDMWSGIDTNRGFEFAWAASDGVPIGSAWLDAAWARSGDNVNKPIVIAFGWDRDDAIRRRDFETLDARDGGVDPNWVAWKWRS